MLERSLRMLSVLVMALLLLTGCDDDVNPFIGTELPYTVWGNINPQADTQAVRVFLIDDILQLVDPNPLDAEVSILELDSGERHVLRDSVIKLPNGDYRHIFWSVFDVQHLNTYRLEVERSDGQLTRSNDIQVPAPVELEVIPTDPNAVSELIQRINVIGQPPALPRVDVTYNAFTVTSDRIRLADNPVTLSYSTGTRVVRDTVRIDLDLRDDFRAIRSDFDENELGGLICIDDVVLDVHVGNAAWQSPTGVFDANFLVEPGSLSNIENGFGFFGAGYIESVQFLPRDLSLVRAGFFDCAAPIETG
ncbi:MAG: DUF4249 family protein [Bacteroidota bacterium]